LAPQEGSETTRFKLPDQACEPPAALKLVWFALSGVNLATSSLSQVLLFCLLHCGSAVLSILIIVISGDIAEPTEFRVTILSKLGVTVAWFGGALLFNRQLVQGAAARDCD
jgi:hypothetical protein